jgi:hypothetical protein
LLGRRRLLLLVLLVFAGGIFNGSCHEEFPYWLVVIPGTKELHLFYDPGPFELRDVIRGL